MDTATVFKEIDLDGFGRIEFVDGATEKLWKQWYDIIASEKWTSDDVSMRTITPRLGSTRAVFARKRASGDLVGCVTWNEYDGVTFIGIFIVVPELRGKGIGRILWDQACDRFPVGQPQGLRGVPAMQPFYRQRNGMDGWQNQHSYTADWKTFIDIFKDRGNLTDSSTQTHYVSQLSAEQFEKLLEFDQFVTGRDRSEFLRLHYALDVTEGVVIFDNNGKVSAMASGVPTIAPEDHLYKICPVYANNTQAASLVALKIVEWFGSRDPKANIVIHVLDGMKGAKEFAPKFEAKTKKSLVGMTLFNGGYENPIKKDWVFVANNNSAHFDA